MLRTLFALILMISPVALSAQDRADGYFNSYEEMRGTLDENAKSRNFKDLLIDFGGADEMTVAQLNQLESQVRTIYTSDFENVAVVRRAELENGWSQELIAYWTNAEYIYVYVLLHVRGDVVAAVATRFNSDFDALNALF